MRKTMLVFLAALLCHLPATAATTGSGSATATTIYETTDMMTVYMQASNSWQSCGMWHSSGICYFLVCDIYECHIETSDRYSMMLPDLIVSTYHDLDNHPYPMIGKMIEKTILQGMSTIYGLLINDSSGTRSNTKNRSNKNVKFRDGDAIGHPGGMFAASYLCNSAATGGNSYFSSFSDAMPWRDYLPVDMLRIETWIPGMREVGSFPLNTWGNVLPRTGWLVQQHDVKLAAVLSQRMADIVTRQGEAHTYNYLSSGGTTQRNGQTVFDPPSAMENLLTGGQWQMSAPYKGTPPTVCHVFGQNDSASPVGYGDFETSKVESYAYSLWRPYGCCDTKGTFLFAIIWGMW
ncbi:MAG: TIGR03756 family integrating conjugative element protein [Azonexus sp.]|jgi:integrating conjugative element protein (TIGR03756 family)|nr:TIGR03756 family integrating conjugative element protein [Nitrospira sp.]